MIHLLYVPIIGLERRWKNMLNEQNIRSAIDNAITNSNLDDLVNDYNAKEKISEIIQDAIVAALQAYDRQQKQ